MPNTPIDVVRRFYAAFASGEVAVFDDILTDDWELKPPLFGTPGTVEGEKQTIGYLHSVLTDITYTVEEIFECGDGVVACRNLLKGVQTAPFLGLSSVGAPIALMTMEFHYLKDGRIFKTWHLEDFFGVYMQLQQAGAQPETGSQGGGV